MDTNQKGAIAEAAIALEALKLGIPTLKPVAEHCRYDLALELDGKIARVQCKWASLKEGVVRVSLQSSWLAPHGYVRTTYDASEIDAVAAYCQELDQCYLLPVEAIAGMRLIYLRLEPTRNGQRAGLNWAADYTFPGAVAQLEERYRGTVEARGSNPLSSTSDDPPAETLGAHDFRNRFGWYMERSSLGERFLITRRGRPFARLGPP